MIGDDVPKFPTYTWEYNPPITLDDVRQLVVAMRKIPRKLLKHIGLVSVSSELHRKLWDIAYMDASNVNGALVGPYSLAEVFTFRGRIKISCQATVVRVRPNEFCADTYEETVP